MVPRRRAPLPAALVAAVAVLLGLPLVALVDVPAARAAGEPVAASVAAPRADREPFTTTDAFVPVLDGPRRDHTTVIDTRLYRPRTATRSRPAPAVLMTHGFGLTKASAEVVNTATYLARHGYVVLTYTAQGFGASSGCVSLQSRDHDVADARQLITKVLAEAPFVLRDRRGPVVGMVGGSYGGGIQANVAEADRRIRAVVPFRTWNHLQYSLAPNNWVVPGDPTGFTHELHEQGVYKRLWTSAFFASGQQQTVDGEPSCLVDGADGGGVPCGGFRVEVCRTFASVSATGDATEADRALLAASSAPAGIDRLRVPVLLVQGQSDTLFNLNDAAATYTALRRRGVPVQMIWNSGGHGGYNSAPGECEPFDGGGSADTFEDCYLPQRVLRFLDAHLRGRGTPGPGFSWFRDWVPFQGDGPTTAYADAPRFPLPRATTFTLSGADALVADPAVAQAGSVSIVDPAGALPPTYTETPNFTGPSASPRVPLPPTDGEGQVADFTSGPFARARTVVGVPEVRLRLSHTAPTDLVLFARVFDVAPDGSAELIHRHVAPARIPSDQLGSPVRIKLLGFAHRFAAGHAVRLSLSTTDAAFYADAVPDVVTVTTGPGATFVLP